jgi:hypothetical protein
MSQTKMMNKAPIFVNGFARGGTNIIMNLLASHPDVGILSAELHQIFYGFGSKGIERYIDRAFYLPIFILSRQHIFWHGHLKERKKIPSFLHSYIDWILFKNKIKEAKRISSVKKENYNKTILKNLRMLSKNPNGLIFTNKLFLKMYPDATFIGLIRNGFAVCEGLKRRGMAIDEAAKMYEIVCQRMINDEKMLPNYFIVRFENMISEPLHFIKNLYKNVGLNPDKVDKIRLQAKKSMAKNGSREYVLGEKDRQMLYLSVADINKYFRKDVDNNQIKALGPKDQNIIKHIAGKSLNHFGYA